MRVLHSVPKRQRSPVKGCGGRDINSSSCVTRGCGGQGTGHRDHGNCVLCGCRRWLCATRLRIRSKRRATNKAEDMKQKLGHEKFLILLFYKYDTIILLYLNQYDIPPNTITWATLGLRTSTRALTILLVSRRSFVYNILPSHHTCLGFYTFWNHRRRHTICYDAIRRAWWMSVQIDDLLCTSSR
jgi:hypothetical protein